MIIYGSQLFEKASQGILQIKDRHNQEAIKLRQASEGVIRFSYFSISISTLLSIIIFLTAIFRANFIECQRRQAESALRDSEQQLQLVLEGGQLGFWDWNILTNKVQRNARWAEMLGYSYAEIQQTTAQWSDFIYPDDREKAWQSIYDVLEGKKSTHELEYRMLHKDGSIRWILDHANIVQRDENGKPIRMTGIHSDITKRKASEEEIKQLAFYDPLTGLPNRRKLLDRLHYAIALSHRVTHQFALFMLDLDQFKAVNDYSGHAAGDDLLKQVAQRIIHCLRDSDMVARLGGDEFVIVLENLKIPDDVETIALKIIEELTVPFQLSENVRAQIGVSIGISFYPEHGNTPEKLMDNADTALYQAKNNGRGCFARFSSGNIDKAI
ncbi:MAG: sensor domain-containing diguanylate cyclase [Methylococcaceae bacterium]|nr:sensor domain-containing diguanylate cyclase [Methylococcaceae bacterium]